MEQTTLVHSATVHVDVIVGGYSADDLRKIIKEILSSDAVIDQETVEKDDYSELFHANGELKKGYVHCVSFDMRWDGEITHNMYWHRHVVCIVNSVLGKYEPVDEPDVRVDTEYIVNGTKVIITCSSLNPEIYTDKTGKRALEVPGDALVWYTLVAYNMQDGMYLRAWADPIACGKAAPQPPFITSVPAPDVMLGYTCATCGGHLVEEHIDCEGSFSCVKPFEMHSNELTYGASSELGDVRGYAYRCAGCGSFVTDADGERVSTPDGYIKYLREHGTPYVRLTKPIQ